MSKQKYLVTQFGKSYIPTKSNNAKTIVCSFEKHNYPVYEINNVNYSSNQLTTKQKIQVLIDDGFVVEV